MYPGINSERETGDLGSRLSRPTALGRDDMESYELIFLINTT